MLQSQVNNPDKKVYEVLKRTVDVFLSLGLLIVLSPGLILVALVLTLIHRGNPIYTQKRALTLESKVFSLFKFKTIDFSLEPISTTSEVFKKKNIYTSVNTFCAWLRKTGFDELPQLLNVLLGDMSFVGPRPLSLSDLKIIKNEYPEFHEERKQIKSKPGISGLWQVKGDRDLGIKNLMELENEYESSRSFTMDMRIVFKTLPVMFFAMHSDAYIGDDFATAKKKSKSKKLMIS